MMNKITLNDIMQSLPEIYLNHSRDSNTYNLFFNLCKNIVQESSLNLETGSIELGNIGKVYFPFNEMGSVSTLNLFELDELILFAYYFKSRKLYNRVADIGANLGLHTIIMSKLGWRVDCYEPDPKHLSLLKRNIGLNSLNNVIIHEAAVSNTSGVAEFTRVLGNTTGSHLSGAKKDPYGQLEKFSVKVESILDIINSVDFIKMDVEGQEDKIVLATDSNHWKTTDMVLEVGMKENALSIYTHLSKIGVNSFSQKNSWRKIEHIDQMPTSYKEGSLFISAKEKMIWI